MPQRVPTETSLAYTTLFRSYSLQAIYNGDSNYAGSTGAVEPLTVSMGTTTTATTIEDFGSDADITGPVPLGSTVNDSATVTGSPAGYATPVNASHKSNTYAAAGTYRDQPRLHDALPIV